MPRLLAFLPCERVIIASEDNSASLMTIMQGFRFGEDVAPTEEAPQTLPLRWSVFTLWLQRPEDEGITYEQKVELVAPSGNLLISQTTEFAMIKKQHRNMGNVFGFPLVGAGDYQIRLFLRPVVDGKDYEFIADYPLSVAQTSNIGAIADPDKQALTEQ